MYPFRFHSSFAFIFTIAAHLLCDTSTVGQRKETVRPIREVNSVARPGTNRAIAIVGAALIDGRGGAPIRDLVVVVRGERIVAVGKRGTVAVPRNAAIVDAKGLSLLPGMIDSHFHSDKEDLAVLFLKHGVTSVREPGQWIEKYEGLMKSGLPIPRMFLAGPHLDGHGPAFPADSIVVRDDEEVRKAVNAFADQGASVIKVYFRLPVGSIRTAVQVAHARGLPVTSHLEIVNATDAIEAGVDGIEHVTSLGTSLIPPREAEKYRQAVLANNDARQLGRYKMWSEIDIDSHRATVVLKLMATREIFLSATLATFERHPNADSNSSVEVVGFRKMVEFVGRAKRAGIRITVGSHGTGRYVERGWAFQREMELLVDAGLTPLQAIVAGTMENARFFRVADRLGSIEVGKLADLMLVAGDPSKDITAMRNVRGVMLNGQWIVRPNGEPSL